MKKVIICIVGILLLLIFLDRCTTVNITTAFLSSTYKVYPDLKEGVSSKSFEIKQVSSTSHANITYDPVHHFFLMDAADAFLKFDTKGKEVFKLKFHDGLELMRFTAYAFDSTGVYDFSEKEVTKKNFNKAINENQTLDERSWEKTFANYYKAADIVLYGESNSSGNSAIYFRVKMDWLVLSTRKNEERISNNDFVSEITFKGYPAKYNPLFLLKDVAKKIYSDQAATTDDYLNTYFTVKLKEKDLEYPEDMTIDLLTYQKDKVGIRAGYTDLPLSWALSAYYRITQSGEALNFKKYANLYIGFSKPVDTYLNLFAVPKEFRNQTSVSFLKYKLLTSNETEGIGYYIIKNK